MKTKHPVLLLIPGILLLPLAILPAANITWDGSDTTDFGLGTNWAGNVAPADSLTTDIGVFSGAVTANLPELTSSRSITGLNFSTTTGGWTLGSSSAANVLTLGASGITTNGQTSGTNTISANLAVGAAQTWNTGTGGTLKITGSVSLGTSGSSTTFSLIAGGGQNGTLVLDPGSGSSVNLYHNASASGALQVNKTTNLGSALNSTSSINIISNAVSSGIRVAGGQALTVNSGTWLTNDLGSGNTNAFAGNVFLNGGTLASGGGRYLAQFNGTAASTWTVNGGTLKITGGGNSLVNAGYFGLGYAGTAPVAGTTINFNLQNGLVDAARSSGGSHQIGTIAFTTAPSVLMNQSGGVALFGVTTGSNSLTGVSNANVTNNLNIGQAGSSTMGVKAAYTLTGGWLQIAGTLSGAAPAADGGGVSNFNFAGGILTAGTINATNLTTSATATASANQTVVSHPAGTLHNYGGTLAPGGSIISSSSDSFGNVSLSYAPTTGRTVITGGYIGHPGTGTLSFNLNGTTASSVFQNSGSGFYSNATVSGTAFLDDTLVVSLLTGFTPAFSDSFTILTSGGLSGAFSNVAFGSTLATADGGGSFMVNQSGNNVTLTNFTPVPEASALGMLGILGLIPLLHRRRPAARV